MGRRFRLALIVAALTGFALGTGPVAAERSQRGNVIVTVNGGIKPQKLPRHELAPVTVYLSGGVRTSDKTPIPRVNWIRLELAWRGRMFTKGLAVCPRSRLRQRTSGRAIAFCGDSLVGRGVLLAQVFVPNQRPFDLKANLLLFNGKTKAGRPAIWAHAYTSDPPSAFVIPFKVRYEPGRTVLVTTIRRSVGPYPHVASFQVEVSRRFDYRGKRRSYLSANCPVPKSFTAGFLSFARATYAFAGGRRLRVESVRSCRAR
jgi:hypothetical protein